MGKIITYGSQRCLRAYYRDNQGDTFQSVSAEQELISYPIAMLRSPRDLIRYEND